MKKVYITTSIPYVNAKPHVGFAMELAEADALARYYRQKLGNDQVYLLTGTDEHGLKVQKTAKEAGLSEEEFTEQISAQFKRLGQEIDFSGNDFIRTTSARHKKSATELWKLCQKDIYKKKYKALYCAGCEEFKTEKDLVDGLCPTHKEKPEMVEEENYFFALSKYAKELLDIIKSNKLLITPESRKNEVLNWLEGGLEDISISRETSRLKWGIPVPGDETQSMYVWVDALSNYLTGAGFPEAKYQSWWNEETLKIHVIGKDILRFHALIWTGLLLSAKLPLPNIIFAHGHITSGGQKMSKSLGNVMDPFEIIKTFGADPLRYYLLAKIPWDGDGDFTIDKFKAVYKGELSDNWGNLLNRLVVLAEKASIKLPVIDQAGETNVELERFAFNISIEKQAAELKRINKEINDTKPWELVKSDKSKAGELISRWLVEFTSISASLEPVAPATFDSIKAVMKTGQVENLFPRI